MHRPPARRPARPRRSPGPAGSPERARRQAGRFYTTANPFRHPAFLDWAGAAGLPEARIVEPFAGSNRLVRFLEGMDLCRDFRAYDLEPADSRVRRRDTLDSFPTGFPVCVTNPPWLARNSATFRGLDFPDCDYPDLYLHCLDRCLRHCRFVAALVPESFLRVGVRFGAFRPRLRGFVSLTARLFAETGHPTGLALFGPDRAADAVVWMDDRRLGSLRTLERLRPEPRPEGPQMRFNDPAGRLGLHALDDTRGPSIRFCEGRELDGYRVKPTGRHLTRIALEGDLRIHAWNEYLRDFRERTQDVLLTSSKGLRRDGRYRRRLDWRLARGIVHHA